ncbi:MAG TPA: hypothetical protein VG733_19250 [Chthoniobacteraceae bacterium]|nr:hypothetical protein [Chthoniobacteraceae bacterium]
MRDSLDQALHAGSRINAQDLLERTRIHFDRAASAFDAARKLAPEDRYPYIGHIQMVISMATALKRAMGIESISDVNPEQAKVADWLAENIANAETLLNEARRLYGTLSHNRDLLKECEAGLSRLYGDMDAVIRIWEISESRGQVSPRRRRALAQAYLARGDRQWRQLSQPELRRIARLMDDNLRGASREEEDYRLWFEASMLLPDFDYDRAISNLSAWSQRWTSWRSHYYLYILYFLRWLAGRSKSIAEIEEALENCSRLAVGRKYTSEQWIAKAPAWCPLISSLDLGPWDSDSDFWPSELPLKRVNGIIKKIAGPQAGEIQIDGCLHIFFVPGGKRVARHEKPADVQRYIFERNKDEESAVNFYLGFSPAGLRAWMVQPGRVEGGDRDIGLLTPEAYRPVSLSAPELPEHVIQARIRKLDHQTLWRFAYDLTKARMDFDIPLSLDELRDRIEAIFGVDNLFSDKRLGIVDVESLLLQTGDFEVITQGNNRVVRLREVTDQAKPEDKPLYAELGKRDIGWIDFYDAKTGKGRINTSSGQHYHFTSHSVESTSHRELGRDRIVEFAKGNKGNAAVGVRVMAKNATLYEGRVLMPDELRRLVEEEVLKRVRKATDESQTIPLRILENEMSRMFPGAGWLSDRLERTNFAKFINTIPTLIIVGKASQLNVRLSGNRRFGRVPLDSQASTTSSLKKNVPSKKVIGSKVTVGRKIKAENLRQESPQSDHTLSDQEATELIRRVVAEARKQGMARLPLAELGFYCRQELPPQHQFPRTKLSKLVALVAELELGGEGAGQYILLSAPE